ncbi:hypothetical protein [uncultured Propionibacterium sp.]|uniref:hypothetical protein n=1 Tax=uncultured Propionibacterium sp. TaxID=218066 RepID=UPI00292DCFAB|nr:hypothetical protein [uncultured Propionibacterium sp.]
MDPYGSRAPVFEVEIRRTWLPKGRRTKIHVDGEKAARSFFGALPLAVRTIEAPSHRAEPGHRADHPRTGPASCETDCEKIAVVLDNAGFHHAKTSTGRYEPGQPWNASQLSTCRRARPVTILSSASGETAKDHVFDLRRKTPEETFGAFASYITGRALDHDLEHPLTPRLQTISFHDDHTPRSGANGPERVHDRQPRRGPPPHGSRVGGDHRR